MSRAAQWCTIVPVNAANQFLSLLSARTLIMAVFSLFQGTMLQKYGRHGNPKYHYFRLAADDRELQWESKNVSMPMHTTGHCCCQLLQHSSCSPRLAAVGHAVFLAMLCLSQAPSAVPPLYYIHRAASGAFP